MPLHETRLKFGGNGAAQPGVRETQATDPRLPIIRQTGGSIDPELPTIQRKGGEVTPFTVQNQGGITAETIRDDPFGSIGLLLRNVAAGLKGTKLPSDTLRENLAAQHELALKRFTLSLNALKQATEFGENLSADKRESLINNYGAFIERSGVNRKEFENVLRSALDEPDTADLLKRIGPLAESALKFCGPTAEGIQECFRKPEVVKMLERDTDARNKPELLFRLTRVIEMLNSLDPAVQKTLDASLERDAEGNILLNEANIQRYNRTAPEDIKLNESLRGTWERNPDIGTSLKIKMIGAAAETEKVRAKEAAKIEFEKPKISEIEEKGKKFLLGIDPRTGEQKFKVPAGEKPSELSRLLREAGYTDEQAAEIRKGILEKRATITGRTPEDVAAARRAGKKGEFEAEEAEPIPTALVNLLDPLGQDPELGKMTRGEARKQRITIPQDIQIKDLQDAKANAMTATESAWELHEQAGREGAKILSGPGFVGRTFIGMRDAMIGFYELQGVKVSASTDPANYTSALSKAGIESAVMKSRVVDMAFALARRREGGRLTDQDVARAIETIGANTGSPAAFTKVLGDVVKRIDREYQIVVQSVTNKRPTSLQEEREFQILAKGLDSSTDAEIKSLSQEARNRLRLIEEIRDEQSR